MVVNENIVIPRVLELSVRSFPPMTSIYSQREEHSLLFSLGFVKSLAKAKLIEDHLCFSEFDLYPKMFSLPKVFSSRCADVHFCQFSVLISVRSNDKM